LYYFYNMPYILLKDIDQYLDQEVLLKGWVFNFRSSGKISFIQFRDGTGQIQGVAVKNEIGDDLWENIIKIVDETSVEMSGLVKQEPRSPYGYEMQVKDLKIIQAPVEEYPIAKKEHGPEFLLDNRHLWLRSTKQWAIQRIRNTIINATFEYLNNQGFIKIDSPILTPTCCEGTTTLFEVPYFDQKAFLTQSGQLYLEAAIMSFGRCFDFGPVFRAEKSKTRRHLTEFWMMDAEAAYVEHQDNMKIQEELILFILQKVLDKHQKDLEILERDPEPLKNIKAPFIRKTHAEVIQELQAMGSDIKENNDLGADDETNLTQKYDQPIFVERYPAAVKAFYMKRDPENPDLVLNNDLLAPEGYGEIIGGSQREDDYQKLLQRIKEHNLSVEDLNWYLDLRKYGSVPHSGFGYGLERIVGWVCGLHHVRETIPFPRTIYRLKP